MRKSLLGSLLVTTATLCFAAAASSLAGRWEVTSSTSYGDTYHLTLIMSESEGKLAGRLILPDGNEVELQNVKLDGDQLTFEVWIQGSSYAVQTKVEGDTLTGTWQGGGDSGKVQARKAQ